MTTIEIIIRLIPAVIALAALFVSLAAFRQKRTQDTTAAQFALLKWCTEMIQSDKPQERRLGLQLADVAVSHPESANDALAQAVMGMAGAVDTEDTTEPDTSRTVTIGRYRVTIATTSRTR